MANLMDPVLRHHTSQERQPAAVPELQNGQPHQSAKQSHAGDHTEQIEATSGEDHRRRTGTEQDGVPQSRSSTYAFYVKKYLQHQQDLYHVFIDFKKAFYRVWHAALWAAMKK